MMPDFRGAICLIGLDDFILCAMPISTTADAARPLEQR